ncbi:MAG: hypothetical protein WCL32_22350 [Planctomycetota bacterium]
MLDLQAVLIGVNDKVLPDFRHELTNNSGAIVSECATCDAAINAFSLDDGVHLFVFLLGHAAELECLQRLSGTFVSQPILVFLAERADPGLVFKAMRAGATQVVTLPLQIEDFKDALNCIALQFNQSRASLKVIAFTGASGGYGVTSVALNAAYEIAFQHKRGAILVECPQQMGMVETYLDLQAQIHRSRSAQVRPESRQPCRAKFTDAYCGPFPPETRRFAGYRCPAAVSSG